MDYEPRARSGGEHRREVPIKANLVGRDGERRPTTVIALSESGVTRLSLGVAAGDAVDPDLSVLGSFPAIVTDIVDRPMIRLTADAAGRIEALFEEAVAKKRNRRWTTFSMKHTSPFPEPIARNITRDSWTSPIARFRPFKNRPPRPIRG